MKLVVTFGCWDLLHVGHVSFLTAASDLGDYLVVGCASDAVVNMDKGASPIIELDDRVRMLNALWCVDEALAYYELGFVKFLREHRPLVLAVGEEWGSSARHAGAEAWADNNGCDVVRIPRTPGVSSSEIRRRMK